MLSIGSLVIAGDYAETGHSTCFILQSFFCMTKMMASNVCDVTRAVSAVAFNNQSIRGCTMGPVIDHPYDYMAHAAGGAVVVEVAKPKTMMGAIAITAAVGAGKEMLDKNFDNADALAWVVGGILWQKYRVRVSTDGDALVLSTTIKFK